MKSFNITRTEWRRVETERKLEIDEKFVDLFRHQLSDCLCNPETGAHIEAPNFTLEDFYHVADNDYDYNVDILEKKFSYIHAYITVDYPQAKWGSLSVSTTWHDLIWDYINDSLWDEEEKDIDWDTDDWQDDVEPIHDDESED